MGRDTYSFRSLDKERYKRKTLDPKWRGVGLILVAIFATAGYYFADWFLRANAENGWIYIPPAALYPKFVPFLGGGLLIKIIVAFLFTLLSYTILSVIYAMAFPIRPGETDAPVDRKVEQRKKRRERIEQKKRKKY
ncbi:MAG: hypothetical protein WBB65_05535 [Anaerolineales bacterium]